MKRTVFIATAVALIAAFFVGSHVYKSWRIEELGFMAQGNAETFVRPYSPTLGSDDAKVYLVKFSDPACETCAAFSLYGKQALETLDLHWIQSLIRKRKLQWVAHCARRGEENLTWKRMVREVEDGKSN